MSKDKAQKAAELFVRCLEAEGVEYVFGVPGEENAEFMRALQQSESVNFVLCRHEQGAAFMADAYGRLTGRVACCLGTLGPGSTNLITGVANANMDHAPMLVLTAQGETTRLHRESHQIMDVVEMFQPVTKWSASVIRAETIPEIVRKAVRVARTEKPGAVHVELPEDIAGERVEGRPMTPIRFRRPVPDTETVERAVAMLRTARQPVILAGNGCVRKRASQELRSFCETTGIGVLSTFMGKGAIGLDDERCLFTVGLGTKDLPTLVIDQADLVIALGVDMVEYPPRLWNPGGDKPIIHADFLPAETDQHYHPRVELVGDIAGTVAKLNARIHELPGLDFDLGNQSRLRAEMLAELHAHDEDETVGSIRPQKVLADVRSVLGPKALLISDVGAHKMWIARHYHCHEPNTCLIPNGFCSMGFALPAAIAAGLVIPDRKILAIAGDGGFLMNVQEMETARRLRSPIVVMIWEDGGYGLISWKQEAEFGEHTDLAFGNPDWQQLAQAFGWHGHRVERSADLKDVLNQACAQDGPSLITLPIDYRENMRLSERLGELSEAIR